MRDAQKVTLITVKRKSNFSIGLLSLVGWYFFAFENIAPRVLNLLTFNLSLAVKEMLPYQPNKIVINSILRLGNIGAALR